MQKELQDPAKDESLLKELQEGLLKLEQDISMVKKEQENFIEMTKGIAEECLLYELYKAMLEQEIISKEILPSTGSCDKLGGRLVLKKEIEENQEIIEQMKIKLQELSNNEIHFKS